MVSEMSLDGILSAMAMYLKIYFLIEIYMHILISLKFLFIIIIYLFIFIKKSLI